MRRVGTVVRTAGRLAIVRSPDESHPSIGETVIDETLSRVGSVVDVFGPVSRPYLLVAPDDTTAAALLNRPLYVR